MLRRRWPLAAWRCSLLALLLAGPVLRPFFPFVASAGGNIVLALCLYTVATRCDRQVAKGAHIATMGAYVVSELVNPGKFVTLTALLQVTTVYAVPLVYGHNVRVRREAVEELARQERSYEEERAARAALQERANIARELHDVVAHCMSVIAIQAGAAALRSPEAPPVVKEDLADIRRTALEALTEMRRVLGILRQDGTDDTPQPDLERIRDLAAGAEAAGLQVSMDVTVAPGPVSPGVSVSAYRIVQESLSNAMRHAPGSAVRRLRRLSRLPARDPGAGGERPATGPAARAGGRPRTARAGRDARAGHHAARRAQRRAHARRRVPRSRHPAAAALVIRVLIPDRPGDGRGRSMAGRRSQRRVEDVGPRCGFR